MMQGEVTTPGCFLEAKDYFAANFLAYCIDTWTSSDIQNMLPAALADLKLTQEDVFNQEGFIVNRLITFIKNNKAILESEFRSVYEERTQEALSRLFKTLNDGTFYNHIISEFSTLQARLFHLGKELDQYKEQEGRIQVNDPMLAQIKI